MREIMSTKNKDQYIQADIRNKAADYYLKNNSTYSEVAKKFGVGESSVRLWVKSQRVKGKKSLKLKRRGRESITTLDKSQSKIIFNSIIDKEPEQLKLPYHLWTRESVCELIKSKFEIKLSKWTIGRYLKNWGMTPQKPATRYYEQDPKEVKKWLDLDYPKIKRNAIKEHAEIHWCDETGIRSYDQIGRTYGIKGQTPIVKRHSKKHKINMISSVTNKGLLRFMIYEGKCGSDVFLSFTKRLVKSSNKKIFLILDNYRIHKSKIVSDWAKENKQKIKLIYLPKYSPELNPDEYLNNDLKQQIKKTTKAKNKDELKIKVNKVMRTIQHNKKRVRGYCNTKHTKYANI
jgi:transposase